jgi:hypothetical protein
MKDNEMGGTCSTYGERRGAYRIFVGKPEGRRPLGRPRFKWEDNITKSGSSRSGNGGEGAWAWVN